MYSDTNKVKQKTAKLTKRACAFKGYANSYTANILDSFNPELQIKDTESAIKSELIDLLIQLKVFKFMTILLLELKKIGSDDNSFFLGVMIKQNMTNFIHTQKQRQLLMKVALMMYLSLYYNYKNLKGKVQAGLLIQP